MHRGGFAAVVEGGGEGLGAGVGGVFALGDDDGDGGRLDLGVARAAVVVDFDRVVAGDGPGQDVVLWAAADRVVFEQVATVGRLPIAIPALRVIRFLDPQIHIGHRVPG